MYFSQALNDPILPHPDITSSRKNRAPHFWGLLWWQKYRGRDDFPVVITDGESTNGKPVIGLLSRDEFDSLWLSVFKVVLSDDLHGVFNRFGTRTGENSSGKCSLTLIDKKLGQFLGSFVTRNSRKGVNDIINGVFHGLSDLFIAMANGRHSSTGVCVKNGSHFTRGVVSDS
ncbi:hypothetical protein WICPIJ_004571 [Wickerhamomyces pijperi]|uniref:Uncharacterized protein n=1 Tax=Wickerhamomyces pijperi TaxID=599730 RepID=A0A9P8Q7I4_WICPI|nr:hypothetical protein WICPIJ_004571 [Wickerhamomyces pijperi]